jgi:hypothetical protein
MKHKKKLYKRSSRSASMRNIYFDSLVSGIDAPVHPTGSPVMATKQAFNSSFERSMSKNREALIALAKW